MKIRLLILLGLGCGLAISILMVSTRRTTPASAPHVEGTKGKSSPATSQVKFGSPPSSPQKASEEQFAPGTLGSVVTHTAQGAFTQAVIYGGEFSRPLRGKAANRDIGSDASERVKKELELEKVRKALVQGGQTNNYNPAVTERWFELRGLARSLREGMSRSEVLLVFGPPTYSKENPKGADFVYDPKPRSGPLGSQDFRILGIRFDEAGKLQTWEWFHRWIN